MQASAEGSAAYITLFIAPKPGGINDPSCEKRVVKPNTRGRRLAGESEGAFVDTLHSSGMAPVMLKWNAAITCQK